MSGKRDQRLRPAAAALTFVLLISGCTTAGSTDPPSASSTTAGTQAETTTITMPNSNVTITAGNGACPSSSSTASCDGAPTAADASFRCGDLLNYNGTLYRCIGAFDYSTNSVDCAVTEGVYCNNNIQPDNAAWGSHAWEDTGVTCN